MKEIKSKMEILKMAQQNLTNIKDFYRLEDSLKQYAPKFEIKDIKEEM